jgi:hypothetical protein
VFSGKCIAEIHVQAFVNEKAGIRHRNKKKDLFQRKTPEINGYQVFRVKALHAAAGKINISGNENEGIEGKGRKKSGPGFIEPDPLIERQYKGKKECNEIKP